MILESIRRMFVDFVIHSGNEWSENETMKILITLEKIDNKVLSFSLACIYWKSHALLAS